MESCNCSCNKFVINYDIAQISSFDKVHTDTNVSVMSIGKNSIGFIYRVLIKFNFGHLPKNVKILNAMLTINVTNAVPECASHKLKAYSLGSNWCSAAVNWNNQPPINWNNGLINRSVCEWQKYSFDFTNEVIKWYRFPETNYGMVLICSDELCYDKIQIAVEESKCNKLMLEIKYYLEKDINIVPTRYFEYFESVNVSSAGEYFTTIRNISLTKTVAYFVKNNDSVPINVVFEYTPDGVNFIREDVIFKIAPSTSQLIFPGLFCKYIRLSITVPSGGITATVNTWLGLQE